MHHNDTLAMQWLLESIVSEFSPAQGVTRCTQNDESVTYFKVSYDL